MATTGSVPRSEATDHALAPSVPLPQRVCYEHRRARRRALRAIIKPRAALLRWRRNAVQPSQPPQPPPPQQWGPPSPPAYPYPPGYYPPPRSDSGKIVLIIVAVIVIGVLVTWVLAAVLYVMAGSLITGP